MGALELRSVKRGSVQSNFLGRSMGFLSEGVKLANSFSEESKTLTKVSCICCVRTFAKILEH